MARTVGALSTHLAGTSHTRCYMMLLRLRNGEFMGVTDHDVPLDYDLTDAGAGEVTYSAASGISPSDVILASGMDASNFEAKGPLGGLVTRRALSGGKFDRARVWLFQLNWENTASGKIPIMLGSVSEGKIEGGKFSFQVRNDADRLNQVIGRLITPICDADFGDARCGVTPESIVGTVSSVTDAMSFSVTFSGSYVDDYFNLGTVEPLVGYLAGNPPIEIFDWTAAGAITLFTPFPANPLVGDTMTIKRGCSKLRKSDDASLPTCLGYANVLRFRGFPEVPGTDQVLKYPIPGS